MESLLNQLVKDHTDKGKEFKKQTQLMTTIVKNQEKMFDLEKKRFEQEQRDRRDRNRGSGDANRFPAIMGTKPAAQKPKDKKDGGGGLLDMLGLGGMKPFISAIKAITPALLKFGAAIAPMAAKVGLLAGAVVATTKTISDIADTVYKQTGGRGKTAKGVEFGLNDINQLKEKYLKNLDEKNLRYNEKGHETPMALAMRKEFEEVEDLMRDRKKLNDETFQMKENIKNEIKAYEKERDKPGTSEKDKKMYQGIIDRKQAEAQQEIADNTKKLAEMFEKLTVEFGHLGVSNEELIQHQIDTRRRDIQTIKESERGKYRDAPLSSHLTGGFNYDLFQDSVSIEQKQKGGHINVPGSGEGDKVPMLLPGGSFVMNKNAAAMLQTGGLVPTLLEPGEKVFGPGQYGPMEMMMNQTFSRFAEGGVVHSGKKEKAEDSPDDGKESFGLVNPTPNTNIADNKGGYAADTGLDIIGKTGDPIVASASGTLEYLEKGHTAQMGQDSDPNKPGVQDQHSYRIKLDNPFTYNGKRVNFIYGTHLSSMNPELANQSGVHVDAGTTLGAMGVANSVPHLHIGLIGDRQQTEFLDFKEVRSVLMGAKTEPGTGSTGENSDGSTSTGGGSGGKGGLGEIDFFGGIIKAMGGDAYSQFTEGLNMFSGILGDGIMNLLSGGGDGSTEQASTNDGIGNASGMATGAAAATGFESMGFSAEQWDIYRNSVAQIESGGNYQALGGSNDHYDGRYQMGAAAKTDGARVAGIADPGHDAAAREAFRNNPELQEQLFAGFTAANYNYLMKNSKFSGASKKRQLEILGYAHNQGMGGAETWMNTGQVGSDGFGTKGTAYSELIKENLKAAGYQRGGMVNMSGGAAYSDSMVTKSQDMFAQKIGEAVTPIVIPMPMGGGSSPAPQQGVNTAFPNLPAEDTSIVSMEYKYRITMGASV